MILTRQQTETIFKVCNLLDCNVTLHNEGDFIFSHNEYNIIIGMDYDDTYRTELYNIRQLDKYPDSLLVINTEL